MVERGDDLHMVHAKPFKGLEGEGPQLVGLWVMGEKWGLGGCSSQRNLKLGQPIGCL